jgi:hypothetical protein
MMLKPDAAEIEKLVRELATAPWMSGSRAGWPLYVFRIEDLPAAVRILSTGELLSRNEALRRGVLGYDTASPSVMEYAPDWCKACVRLYFRPRTPTEYQSEGFRPQTSLPLGAHRPVPVVLVFDALKVLTDKRTSFTDGNATKKRCRRGETAAFLKSIPFERVYHIGPFVESDRDEIVFRRCAEVLVEKHMALDNLRRIFCRSQAEFETLLTMLSPELRARYAKRIGVSASLFNLKWTYLERVDLTDTHANFHFSPSTLTPGPFSASLDVTERDGTVLGTWTSPKFMSDPDFTIKFYRPFSAYKIRLELDGHIAYCNSYSAEELVF